MQQQIQFFFLAEREIPLLVEIVPDKLNASGNSGAFSPERAVHLTDVGIKHAPRSQPLQQVHQMGGITGKVERAAVDHEPHFALNDADRILEHIIVHLLPVHGNVTFCFGVVAGVDKMQRNAGRFVLVQLDGKAPLDLLERIAS